MTFTKRQEEIIKDNLKAYEANFGYISIVKEDYGKGFYVFTDEERKASGSWTQYCYNIDYLNGWLYGAVQAVNGRMQPKREEELVSLEQMLQEAKSDISDLRENTKKEREKAIKEKKMEQESEKKIKKQAHSRYK